MGTGGLSSLCVFGRGSLRGEKAFRLSQIPWDSWRHFTRIVGAASGRALGPAKAARAIGDLSSLAVGPTSSPGERVW